VSDRRASLDEETTIRKLVETELARGANIPVVAFPEDSAAIQDSPRLTLVLVQPETEWKCGGFIPVLARVALEIKAALSTATQGARDW
jgi:hypothetical protein